MTRRLHLVVPGPLDQRTGGYVYDARMTGGLRTRGWRVDVHELAGAFPGPDDTARRALAGALASMDGDDLVVIDGLAMGALPEPVAEHADRLRILSLVHHPLADEGGFDETTRERLAAREGDALGSCRGAIATSAYIARRLEAFGVDAHRIRVAPPGTDRADPARGPSDGEAPLLLSVGTVTPRKGHDVLVAALERVADLSWRCVCVGSLERTPRHARHVRERVAVSGLSDRLDLSGEVDDPSLDRLYDAATVFVLASRYEGYGMVLTEALARGLPVVATTAGAIPDTVPADASVLVAPDDASALAAALRTVLIDPARRRAMATAALVHAETLPDWAEAAASFEAALLALADR